MSCNCTFDSNQAVIDKVRSKEMHDAPLPNPFNIKCECGSEIVMDTHVYTCNNCASVYGVTPCHADDINSVVVVSGA